jgi:hypothetical protein
MFERALFEAHVDLKVKDGETAINLEFATLWVPLDDEIVLGVGKFLTPFGFYNEQIHTTWLNRLPDEPLPVADHAGVAPTHAIGVQLRGARTLAGHRVVWGVYASNAPSAEIAGDTQAHGEPPPPEEVPLVPMATGALDHDSYHRWAVGGRIGVLCIPPLEVGYSVQVARVDPVDGPLAKVQLTTHGLDVNYTEIVGSLDGTLDVHFEYVHAAADPARATDWPAERSRAGMYLQGAFRPSEADSPTVRKLEGVVRYDRLDTPDGGATTQRVTLGVDYWFQSSIVAKLAAQVTDEPHTDRETKRVFFQLAGGF